ncbi:MAG: DNA recombination protein RmuC [Candidatus Korobacteraceae bacterium]
MSFALAILLLVVGVALGAGFAAMAARSKTAALAERSSALENDASILRSETASLRAQHNDLLESKAGLEATLASERRNAEEKLQLLTHAGDEMRAQFESLAARALQNNNANFLDLAKATLERQQAEAKGELEKREKAVETLVKPIAESLKLVDEQVRALEEKRAHAYGTLSTQVASLLETQRALQTETGNLVKALREPQARGRWGEVQLRRVIEMAGMLAYCDFDEQVTVIGEDRRIRPDVVVKLPGDKQIVIDAKAPIMAYLASLEAPDDATRNLLLVDHARQVRAHIESLGSKRYWQQFEATPEFVILFLPGEVFFRAAWDAYPELIEESVSQGVVVASPVTLIALLKAVAYGWNQRNVEESARKLIEASTTLYERLCTMTRHFDNLGSKLGGALDAYNSTIGSMQRSVFPAGRKVAELNSSLQAEALPDLEPIDKSARQLDAPDWRDEDVENRLLFPEEADSAKA